MIEAEKRDRAAALRHPVWINRQGARVGLDGLTLEVAMPDERHRLRLDDCEWQALHRRAPADDLRPSRMRPRPLLQRPKLRLPVALRQGANRVE